MLSIKISLAVVQQMQTFLQTLNNISKLVSEGVCAYLTFNLKVPKFKKKKEGTIQVTIFKNHHPPGPPPPKKNIPFCGVNKIYVTKSLHLIKLGFFSISQQNCQSTFLLSTFWGFRSQQTWFRTAAHTLFAARCIFVSAELDLDLIKFKKTEMGNYDTKMGYKNA